MIRVDQDHVYLHLAIPVDDAVSEAVKTLKNVTSRRLQEKFSHYLNKVAPEKGGIWKEGFCAFPDKINGETFVHVSEPQVGRGVAHPPFAL